MMNYRQLIYTDMAIGTCVYCINTGETAVIERRMSNGLLVLRLTDGPDVNAAEVFSPAAVIAFWRAVEETQ